MEMLDREGNPRRTGASGQANEQGAVPALRASHSRAVPAPIARQVDDNLPRTHLPFISNATLSRPRPGHCFAA